MNRRLTTLALVTLIACVVMIIPIGYSAVFFAFASGGTSLYLGIALLLALASMAMIIVARRIVRRR